MLKTKACGYRDFYPILSMIIEKVILRSILVEASKITACSWLGSIKSMDLFNIETRIKSSLYCDTILRFNATWNGNNVLISI